MNDSLVDISGAPQPAPHRERAAHRESEPPNRLPRYVSFVFLLAALSAVAGYQIARLEIAGSSWFHTAPPLESARVQTAALVPASNPRANSTQMEAISRLAPQQQAERLLELVIQRSSRACRRRGNRPRRQQPDEVAAESRKTSQSNSKRS